MKIFNVVLWISFVLIISAASFLSPLYNWDILGYMASALSYDIRFPQLVHEKTYSIAQGTMPAAKYKELVSPEYPLRARAAADPQFFCDQLFAFKVKPLYIAGMYLLFKLGIPLARASVLISIFSAACICAIIFRWLAKYLSLKIAGLFALILALAVRLPYLARLSSPDALSAAIVLGGFYLLIEKRLVLLSCVLFLVSVFARFDNIILVWLVLGYLCLWAPAPFALKRPKAILFFLLSIVIMGAIFLTAKTDIWPGLSRNVLLGLNTDVAGAGAFSFSQYFQALFLGLARIMWDYEFTTSAVIFLAWGLLFLICRPGKLSGCAIETHIILICLLSILVHYVFYPQLIDRLFTANYVMIVIMSLRQLENQAGLKKTGGYPA